MNDATENRRPYRRKKTKDEIIDKLNREGEELLDEVLRLRRENERLSELYDRERKHRKSLDRTYTIGYFMIAAILLAAWVYVGSPSIREVKTSYEIYRADKASRFTPHQDYGDSSDYGDGPLTGQH